VSKQLDRGCYPVEQWNSCTDGRDWNNSGPLALNGRVNHSATEPRATLLGVIVEGLMACPCSLNTR